MPMGAARPCTQPGCRALVRGGVGRCPEHPYAPRPATSGSKDPFYSSSRWRAARRCYLVKHPFCSCGAKATVVDHILARAVRPDLEWVSSNWQALCHPCHARKSATQDGWMGNRRRT